MQPLTLLYAPADRPELVEKAIASRAHAVIVDLEDAVAPAGKEAARARLPELLAGPFDKPVNVRVNALGTPWARADLEAVRELRALAGVHVPKVERADDVDELAALLGDAPLRLHCLLESALGVEHAFAIAAHPRVASLSLGESDLRSALGVAERGLDWARSRTINAAAAAGRPRPPQSVYPHVRDLDGLARSCARGRALGHLGRAAIHPAQLEPIEQAYLPTRDELDRAEALVAGARAQEGRGVGAYALPDGSFVDVAIVRGAELTVALADAYGVRT